MDPITKRLTALVERLSRSMETLEAAAFEASSYADLTPRQIHYLDVIAEMGHPSPGSLAQRLELSRPAVTGALDRLVSAGYLRRERSEEDRRVFHVLPTKRAAGLRDLHRRIHREYAERIRDALSETDAAALASLLERIIESLDPKDGHRD